MPYVLVTERYIREGDPDIPSRHPVALAFNDLFPEYEAEVRYTRHVGWEVQVAQYIMKLTGSLVDLCDELDHLNIPGDLWGLWRPDDETWKTWVWESWKTHPLGMFAPGLDWWLEECQECREACVPKDIADEVCRWCARLVPEE